MGVNRQLQAKNGMKTQYLQSYKRIKAKFEEQAATNNSTSSVVWHYPDRIEYGCHLEKKLSRRLTDCNQIWQTGVKWHADDYTYVNIESLNRIQYGGPPFSKTGSSFISAVDCDISLKFGMQVNFHLFKQKVVTKSKPGSRFPILWPPCWKFDMTSYITPLPIVRLLRNLAGECRMTCRGLRICQNPTRK